MIPGVPDTNSHRRAKVTPETKAESKRLKAIWDNTTERPSQAEFGELYEIGSQSAVNTFLRGGTPLSLKAAVGFAKGLNCNIADFSPRLAAQLAKASGVVPSTGLDAQVATLAYEISDLPDAVREKVLGLCRGLVDVALGGRSASAKRKRGTRGV